MTFLIAAVPAFGASILILDDSMREGTPNEQTLAEGEGHTVTVVDENTWMGMSRSDFAEYDAIVIGDNGCSGTFDDELWPLLANQTWVYAVTGNMVIHTWDYFAHEGDGDGEDFVINGINYAASGTSTGFYLSTGCYGDGEDGTPLEFLLPFGTFRFDDESDDDLTVLDPNHPVLDGITEGGLEGWGNSTHGEFSSVPPDFEVLAIEDDDGDAILIVGIGNAMRPIPTLEEWSLILLSLLLAAAGFVAMRNR